ncbi:MAG: hypothetical protein HWE23_09375 [Rhodobacteraceae bacterium]|nr:hypothetical protein [Paracoccaceae bacterium]
MRKQSLGKLLKKAFSLTAVLAAGVIGLSASANAESPFHTGVWQLNTGSGPQGLVASDWMLFEGGLPRHWLYRRAGTNDANQFDYFTRTIGTSGYTPAGIRVYRTSDTTMDYTVAKKGEEPVTVSAKRLSIPNFQKSCLSVEGKASRLIGSWNGTASSSLKKLRITNSAITVDGKSRKITTEEVRVGRLGILEDGKPIAFFTSAGGDYAVLQWLQPGTSVETMRDTRREILDFVGEEVVRKPGGTCDRQIESRLKTMK